MKNLYKWQRTTIWAIGILTFISITFNTVGKEFNIGYFIDLIFGIGLNILILWLIFLCGNLVYKKIKKEGQKKEEKA